MSSESKLDAVDGQRIIGESRAFIGEQTSIIRELQSFSADV